MGRLSAAVLLDALGTLVELADPAPALAAALRGHGVKLDGDQARTALRAEMAHYRAHCQSAADARSLDALRDDCTTVLAAALPAGVAAAVDHATLRAALLGSLRFHAPDDVVPELRALRAQGRAVVVVSNWDVSLHDVLAETGLRELVDDVVVSAEVGSSKPHAAIFAEALRRAGVGPGDALHAGDDLALDIAGAQAAGIAAVLIARSGQRAPDGVTSLPSLTGLSRVAA